ncbi:MAG: hypothetical protein A3B91_00380 [Candidatus Yanofskybacteria bacterium RIFCSPHIGHO2_02_FULL_41_29]|uniref:Uncharacterized protein n=1 Tax=Candidatus Yanofskybacteria bacterium RIFCSPHIGHO2_01_FULL_41_53 TaxID=1802663 RepID=A0A1F8EJ32_9BACT|nr:MAG: hypothetical protein A2650_01925 [Candidatus Yanofskybacteria bacterium RIFCSPHIGHO2_01_FULL_41_53]OGN11600.1 MAG: hypothetical protein A3B91_00380 [Candidatus Yanofskybacteria bacterium RIFCSPHIGHO2_02_FULL_41_29]OGN22837.1 MAG: hypothetical protein A2916_01975 [Candidatus Yanofskybacteria bacterium RIFCSPLOWO2_01_FULL_41_67]OGN30104.1 MAG: hypothetical protein A3H54_03020 [Candidatus Yanofskybacteria bacterium RIFCSPLOWO2_02_FULL_41_13]OGN35152.1 MAG: hypothetical protein A3F98_00460 
MKTNQSLDTQDLPSEEILLGFGSLSASCLPAGRSAEPARSPADGLLTDLFSMTEFSTKNTGLAGF